VSVDVRDTVERSLQRPPAKEENANRGGQANSGACGGPENLELGHRSNSGQ
jgi:hypothetical protein